jgi:site-specific DNA-cytosine methylase
MNVVSFFAGAGGLDKYMQPHMGHSKTGYKLNYAHIFR